MKKNTLVKLLAVLVMCFMIGAVLVACGEAEVGPKGDKGDKGDTGAAGAPGANGTNGVDGLTPHIGENGNWWIGETDTGVYAKGIKGDKGEDGKNLDDCAEHDWDKDIVIAEHAYDAVADKATEGITLNICKLCGDAKVTWVNHSYDHEGGTVVTAPTCTTGGYTTYTCACGYSYVGDEVAELGHASPAFDAAAVDTTVWTFAEYKAGTEKCDCLKTPVYTADCTNGCGTPVIAEGTPAGHVWGEWTDTVPDATVSPCERDTIQVRNCTKCEHTYEECNQKQTLVPAPGHVITFEWAIDEITNENKVPTFDEGGVLVPVCNVEGCDRHFEPVALPALNAVDYAINVLEGPHCDELGVAEYSYTFEVNTYVDVQEFTYTFEAALQMTGHTYHDNGADDHSAYEVIVEPGFGTVGAVKMTCDVCGEATEYELPALDHPIYNRMYLKNPGKCTYQWDEYSINFSGSGDIAFFNTGSVLVEFKLATDYAHDEEPAELTVVVGEEKVYLMYYCAQGNHYVIVKTFDSVEDYEAYLESLENAGSEGEGSEGELV